MSEPIRLALDQNFPLPILRCLEEYIADIQLVPLRDIDEGLSDLDDRELILTLAQRGWPGLVTNNYRMFKNAREVAAILKTKLTVFAIEGVGDDPIRATGAVLLDLPGALRKVVPDRAQVFWMRPRTPTPVDAWSLLEPIAARAGKTTQELYNEVRVSDAEAATQFIQSNERDATP